MTQRLVRASGRRFGPSAKGSSLVVIAAIITVLAILSIFAEDADASEADNAVAYQINIAHNGVQADSSLSPPFWLRWQVTLPGLVSYPLIAQGLVFVTADDQTTGITDPVRTGSGIGTYRLVAAADAATSVRLSVGERRLRQWARIRHRHRRADDCLRSEHGGSLVVRDAYAPVSFLFCANGCEWCCLHGRCRIGRYALCCGPGDRHCACQAIRRERRQQFPRTFRQRRLCVVRVQPGVRVRAGRTDARPALALQHLLCGRRRQDYGVRERARLHPRLSRKSDFGRGNRKLARQLWPTPAVLPDNRGPRGQRQYDVAS